MEYVPWLIAYAAVLVVSGLTTYALVQDRHLAKRVKELEDRVNTLSCRR